MVNVLWRKDTVMQSSTLIDNAIFALLIGCKLSERGWTEQDVRLFLSANTPERVLGFIRQEDAYAEALATIARNEALAAHGLKDLDQVFTLELTARLGYSPHMRLRFLNQMHVRFARQKDYSQPSIRTIGELAQMTRIELLREPNLSGRSFSYVQDVLRTIGIQLLDA